MCETAVLSEFKKSARKSRARFHFIDKIANEMKNRIYEDCLYSDSVTVSFDFESGCIDVEMKNDGTCDVSVFHFDNNRSSGMVESAISDSMPDWNSIQLEVEEGERENREFQDYLWRNSRYW